MRIAVFRAVAFMIVALLTACTPNPDSAPTISEPASAVPTPSPTATPPADPLSRLPITCDEVVSAATRDDLLGAEAERSLWRGVAGWRQGDMSECHWTTPSSGFIQVWILVDAAQAYEAGIVATLGARPVGDRSGSCHDDPEDGVTSCSLQGLAGTYWYEVTSATLPGASLESLALLLHTEVSSALASAGAPLPDWSSPPDAVETGATCAPYDGLAFREAAGAAVGPVQENQFATVVGSIIWEAARRSGELVCQWAATGAAAPGEFASATFQGLTGSGWAWDEAVAQREDTAGRPLDPLDVPGADAGVKRCERGSCTILVLVDGTMFTASFQRYDETEIDVERVIAAAAAWVAVLTG
jgi:hypothetical protein